MTNAEFIISAEKCRLRAGESIIRSQAIEPSDDRDDDDLYGAEEGV